MLNIRVIGDSSSSGIGSARVCYPHLLAECPRLLSRSDVRVVNYSVPGLTSADAASFCASAGFRRPFDVLVVFLGNNEGVCTTRKGVPGRWRRLLRSLALASHRRLNPPQAPDSGFAFEKTLPTIRANTPEEFRQNLLLVIAAARAAGAFVVLINPVANLAFPAGLFATNGLFFHLIGLTDVGMLLRGTDRDSIRLVAAIRCHEEGRTDDARALYEPLACCSNGLVAFIARFNRAATRHAASESIASLQELLGAYPYYDSIVLYALSQLHERHGSRANASRSREQAYESDRSTYRVTNAYRDAIRALAGERGVALVDLSELLEPRHFVDHCHPTPEGHQRIADALSDVLCRLTPERTAVGAARYQDQFISPNSFFDDADLVSYYQIDRTLPAPHIREELRHLTVQRPGERPSRSSALRSYLVQFLNSNDRHAAFNTELDLLGAQAPLSHEVLAFPEFYLHRLLYNYGRAFEAMGLSSRIDAEHACARLILPSSEYKRLILRHNMCSLDMPLNLSRRYLDAIQSRLPDALGGPAFANRIGVRIKTIRVWYTREAFRYGTHSRVSMWYDRWAIEQIAEATGIAAVIAAHNGLDDRLDHCGALLRELAELDRRHETHVTRYCENPRAFSPRAYEEDLHRIETRVASLL